MNELIKRQAAIEALAKLSYENNMPEEWHKGISASISCLCRVPSEHPSNAVNLCDSCKYLYPICPATYDDLIFGNGIGNDNICACGKYEVTVQPERQKGKWTSDNACELCGFQPWFERDIHSLSYCPNCGADMRTET